jgi:hypothetical protein
MKTLTITISDKEYGVFGLKKQALSYAKLYKLIETQIMRKAMDKCLYYAEKYGLSEMTMDEITEEVRAVRRENALRNN